ncbi:MAG: hypothetical protein HZA95_03425 [Candidatus Vogelbacteria bacterium]|nr:hypothetical protein [Candidatus Vogelbacteria bacterium]
MNNNRSKDNEHAEVSRVECMTDNEFSAWERGASTEPDPLRTIHEARSGLRDVASQSSIKSAGRRMFSWRLSGNLQLILAVASMLCTVAILLCLMRIRAEREIVFAVNATLRAELSDTREQLAKMEMSVGLFKQLNGLEFFRAKEGARLSARAAILHSNLDTLFTTLSDKQRHNNSTARSTPIPIVK